MAQPEKNFRIKCVSCELISHVRFSPAGENASGKNSAGAGKNDPVGLRPDAKGDVSVDCQYCGASNMVTIPREYIGVEMTLRGIKPE